MNVLRTPDTRFEGLQDFDFQAHYTDVDADGQPLRIAWIEAGVGPTVLLLHGEPSYSYLYRKMIPRFAAAGYRAVALDLVGFGRSDKPADTSDYSYERHVSWVRQAIDAIGTDNLHMVCQDWGGLIGLRIAGQEPDLFQSIAAANTFLPDGSSPFPEAFFKWQAFSKSVPEFPVGGVLQMGCATQLSPEVSAAYDAPFPDESYKAGARIFPSLVPTDADDPQSQVNVKAWEGLRSYSRPFLTAFSDQDPITAGADRALQHRIPGAKDQPHTTIPGGGHFLQEDCGEALADVLVAWLDGQ